MNQTCYALVSAHAGKELFVRFAAPMLLDGLVQQAHGSVFDTITTRTFQEARLVVPPEDMIRRVSSVLEPIEGRVLSSIHESRTLAELRDTLLPKLISGELRIPEAEKAAEAVL